MMQNLSITAASLGVLYAGKKFFNGGVNKHREVSMKDKIVIITGSTQGIGKINAKELARRGATIIFACRNQEATEQTIKEIEKLTGNSQLFFMKLDLCDLSTVRTFVTEFKSKYNQLHVLVNNAGVMALPKRVVTKDGFEMQFQTNHLGHFLLTNLLLDVLKNTQQSRVVNLSSLAHTGAKMNFDDLNSEDYKPGMKKLQGQNVKVVALHPGVVRTELAKTAIDAFPLLGQVAVKAIIPLFLYFSKSVEQGTETSLYCCQAPYSELTGGAYYADCVEKKPTLCKNWEEEAQRLWDMSQEMVKL